MGYSVLPDTQSYDTQECAKRCDDVKVSKTSTYCHNMSNVLPQGCSSFNLYYERAPSVDPTVECPNPASETVLKCVYYGGPVSEASTTNDGQWRRDFQVVIAGSNGYVSNAIASPGGYQAGVPLGRRTINAPTKDCEGNPTYMGVKVFQDGPFSVEKCAAACSATSDWNRANPHVWSKETGLPRLCQMFNTYILYNGSTATGQFCSMYDQTWSTAFATEEGQWRGNDYFNMDYSFMFSNTTGAADRPESCDNPTSPGGSAVQKCNAETQYWDRAAKTCTDYPVCNTNTHWLNKETKACVAYPICNSQQYLNKETKTCIAYPRCTSTQYLDTNLKQCIDYPTCDANTQYLDRALRTCVNYPTCTSQQYLDKDKKACITPLPNSCNALLLEGRGNPYRTSDGRSWDLKNCDYFHGGQSFNYARSPLVTATFSDCVDECARVSGCHFATWADESATNQERRCLFFRYALDSRGRLAIDTQLRRGAPFFGAVVM